MRFVSVTLLICLFGCGVIIGQQLDCSIYTTDKQIIQSFPFMLTINPTGATSIGSFATVISLGRVTQLTLTMVSDIPPSIYCLKNLQSLTIQYSNNAVLSSEIARLSQTLTSLTLIRMSDNLILPTELFNLIYLQTLSIVANGLQTLPDAISQLTRLNHLNLSNNRLTSLPSTMANLTRLISLILDNNIDLTSLKDLKTSLILQSLSASNCSIEELPTMTYALATIDFSFNRIKSLENLQNLISDYTSSINFNNNQIAVLPTQIRLASQVQKLDLSNNVLIELPEEVYGLNALTTILIRNNRFSNVEKRWIQGRFAPTKVNVDI